jgi:hypothetical protein
LFLFKLLSITVLLISLTFPVQATSAKIYVWRNDAGVLVFSDSPKAGAEQVVVKTTNNITSSIDTSILDIPSKEVADDYQVVIVQPADNSTIRDNTGSVHVSGLIKPIFKRGLLTQLYMDNIPYGAPQPHSIFALRDIERGEHQIKMTLLNEKGKIIASSPSITFYMHKTSVVKAN